MSYREDSPRRGKLAVEPEILLEDVSPNGNTYAVVECDDRVCFMYMGAEEKTGLGVKSVWVRNLVDAPAELDVAAMQRGEPPVMPAANCRKANAQTLPNPDDLRVVWLPEGNGVALFEREDMLAIIPPWSGQDGFDGYARDCVGEGALAWELTTDNVLRQRFAAAEEHWISWDDDPWPSTADAQIAALESVFGEHTNYYAIDGEQWPPKAMLRFRSDDWQVLATVGVALRPQPNVEMYLDDPAPVRRIELAVALRPDIDEDSVRRIGSYVSAQSGYPWTRYTWFGSGHTIPCDSWSKSEYAYAAITRHSPITVAASLPPVFGDPVNQLWLVPITNGEQRFAESTTTDELLAGLPEGRWMHG